MSKSKDKNRGLGRGLSALLADVDLGNDQDTASATSGSGAENIPIEFIHPNKDQPRRSFDQDELQELASSIAEKGVIQPLILRKLADDHFQIVAGERRWRASQLAKLHMLPAIVRNYSDIEVQEIALIENIQRQDLNVMEEAQAYQALMDTHGHTQEKLSQALGKSRSHIANLLRLLNLSKEIQDFVRDRKLSMGHARALLASDNPLPVAQRVIKENLSVREVEALVKAQASGSPEPTVQTKAAKDADTEILEQELSASTGMKIVIDHKSSGAGVVKIAYRDLEALDEICKILSLNK